MRLAPTTSSIICLLFLPLGGMAQMGIPDSTFNGTGISRLTPDWCGNGARIMQVNAGGDVYVAGNILSGMCQTNQTCQVSKMLSSGVTDSAYAVDGTRVVNFCTSDDYLTDMVLDHSTGEVYACGYEDWGLIPNAPIRQLVTFKLTPGGALDPGFGINGINYDGVVPDGVGRSFGMVRLPSGKLLLSCNATGGLYFVQYLPDGSRDSTFHATGKYNALSLTIEPVGGMVVHNDRIYLAFQGSGFPADRIWVYCFDMNGELDLQYGTNGRAQFQHTTIIEPKDLAAAPDGGILVAGSVGGFGARRRMVLRFDPTGQVDQGYGNNGIVILDSPDEQRFFGVAVLPDGRSLLTGFSTDSWSYYEAYAFVSLGPVGGRVFPMGAVGDTLGATVAPWPGTYAGALVGYDSLERIMVVGGAPSQLVAGHGAIGFARYLNSDSYSIMGEQEAQRVNKDAVFPNPAQGGSEVFVRTSLRGPLQARIMALTGEVISAVPLRSQSGALLAVTVPPELPAGPYLLEVTGQSHRVSSILLVQ